MLELIEGTDLRTKMGRFREVYDLVESASKAGARRETILAKLRDAGLDLSPATFNSYLTRLRKQHSASAAAAAAAAAPAPAPAGQAKSTTPQPAPSLVPALKQGGDDQDARTNPETTKPPGPIDFAAIRGRSHDLEALRRRWRKQQREEAEAAKASPPDPGAPEPTAPGPAEPP